MGCPFGTSSSFFGASGGCRRSDKGVTDAELELVSGGRCLDSPPAAAGAAEMFAFVLLVSIGFGDIGLSSDLVSPGAWPDVAMSA